MVIFQYRREVSLLCMGMAVLLMIAGCAGQNSAGIIPSHDDIGVMNSRSMDEPYVIGAGDLLSVKFYYNEKLNEDLMVRPDGKISLQLIGDIAAAGMTPTQLSNDITARYSEAFHSSAESYVLGVGDSIAIRSFYNEGLNDEVTIRRDGKISLQLIGDIAASGLTPAQLGNNISAKYAELFMSSTEAYAIGVGDALSLKFLYSDSLNDEITVRQDGKIALQLVEEEIKAAGLTVSELRSLLMKEYSTVLDNPQLTVKIKSFRTPLITVAVKTSKTPIATVIVKEFSSQKVYVGGEVGAPGLIHMKGMTTALGALIQAGGSKNSAELNNVVLLRYNMAQKPQAYLLNVDNIMSGETPDVILRPYDVLYVPKTVIAKVDLFMDQYLYKLLPINVMFGFQYYLNKSSSDVHVK